MSFFLLFSLFLIFVCMLYYPSGKNTKKKNEDMNAVALRAYELSKLRYYFAIAVTDSPRTAEALYQQLDGIEFEHSAMVFDMRFVPDDVR